MYKKLMTLIVFIAVASCLLIKFPKTIVVAEELPVLGWGFKRNNNHETPEIGYYQDIIKNLDAFYVGDTTSKKVYLTFDAGYDNGNLPVILDILKLKNVKATFFVTGDFVNRYTDLLKRMIAEGHIVANHSYHHKNLEKMTCDEMLQDIKSLEEAYKEKTGQELVKVFRPPEGSFTKKHLEVLSENGYKTIFWSIAYADWLVDKQKSKEVAYNAIMNNLHAGAIILMHTVSKTNSEVLPLIIDRIIQDGYEFDLVTNLQKKIS